MTADREHPDALPTGPVRGRGAGLNPGNRFEGESVVRLHVLGAHLDETRSEHPGGVQVRTNVLADRTCSIINRVDSDDLPFHWSLNPYRGCEHGCLYCYARPTHETLGLSCGLDFETKIVVKHDAPALLREELARPGWRGEPIAMSGVTDPYQPLERTLRVTRGCLEVMAECRQPVTIVTKSRLVLRDLDLLRELARHGAAAVAISVTTLDDDLAAAMEPRASAPRDRLRAVRELADAGVPVGVLMAPIVPGLTDHEIPRVLEAAAAAGARHATWVLLRLPHQVKALFLEWLHRARPLRAARVEAAIRETRDGALDDSTFGRRQRGAGARAETIAAAFALFARRHGLDGPGSPLSSTSFRRPRSAQMTLFDA
jgi:DNA repair photolyase